MVDAGEALAASARPVAAAETGRGALVVGNVGHLGESLLNAILEDPRYARVAVGVRSAMRSVVPALEAVRLSERDAWDAAATLGRIPEDLFICIEPPRVSYWKHETPYVEVASEAAVALARRLRAAGTRRLALVTPLEPMA